MEVIVIPFSKYSGPPWNFGGPLCHQYLYRAWFGPNTSFWGDQHSFYYVLETKTGWYYLLSYHVWHRDLQSLTSSFDLDRHCFQIRDVDSDSDSVDSPHFCRTRTRWKEKNRTRTRTRLKKIGLGRGLTFLLEWRIIHFLNKIFAKYQFTINLLTC